jgi:hypothetical protein
MHSDFRDKVEFIHKYRKEFELISKHKWYPETKKAPTEVRAAIRHLCERARKELAYSQSTCNVDIMHTLQDYYLNRIV